MILNDYILSASCYGVRLLAALLGVRLVLRPVDVHPGREHLSPEMLALNPAGSVPILQDGDLVLSEPAAILTYLAGLAGPHWLGAGDAAGAARIQQWLAFSARLSRHLGGARLHDMLLLPADIDSLRQGGLADLRQLEAALFEQRLRGQAFLAGAHPTIADIACFPDVALAPDGGMTLDVYPSIRLWTRAIRSLDGFIEMPGIHRLHELAPEPVHAGEEA
jgi:glutathione S-transferase